MSEHTGPSMESLEVQLKAAQAEQVKNVSDSQKDLEKIYVTGKKNADQLSKAQKMAEEYSAAAETAEQQGLPNKRAMLERKDRNQEIISGMEGFDQDLMTQARAKIAEPGVKEALYDKAQQEMGNAEVDKIRLEAKNELGLLAKKIYEKITSLGSEYEEALAEVDKKEVESMKRLAHARDLVHADYQKLIEMDPALAGAFSKFDGDNGDPQQMIDTILNYKTSLGIFSGGKKKTLEHIIEDVDVIAGAKAAYKDYLESHALVNSPRWPGFRPIRTGISSGIAKAAEYQGKIDSKTNAKNNYNGLKNFVIEPLRVQIDRAKDSKLSYQIKALLDEMEYPAK
jgi:hypothetical protein